MKLVSHPALGDPAWLGDHIFEPVLAKEDPLTSWYRAGCNCGWRGEGIYDNGNRAAMSVMLNQWDTQHAVKVRKP